MKLLIDCSNLYAGGGLQVAKSFLNDLRELGLNHNYHIIQSKNFARVFTKDNFPNNFEFYELGEKEEKSILKRRKTMLNLEHKICPSVIFTVFGPSYHKSKAPKVVGFAWGYVIFPKSPFYKKLKWIENLKYKLLNRFKIFFFNKNSDVLIFETYFAKTFYEKKYAKDVKCFFVSNTLNELFYNPNLLSHYPLIENGNKAKILFLTANYKHKNINILPGVIDCLINEYGYDNFKFYISINDNEVNFSEHHKKYIHFLGRVKEEHLPSLYNDIDLVFMPTLLETFSVTYLEAMFMMKPIVASDMEFSRDICRNSAYFCSPTSPYEYAKAIFELISNDDLRNDLVQKGVENLKRFGTSMDRTKSYISILEQFSNNKNADY